MFVLFTIAPTGVPTSLSAFISFNAVTVTWDVIDCIERNGIITGYVVEFQEQGGARITGEVVGQSFTAAGLTPATRYTFRVAGVNSNGTGPFTAERTFTTINGRKLMHSGPVHRNNVGAFYV